MIDRRSILSSLFIVPVIPLIDPSMFAPKGTLFDKCGRVPLYLPSEFDGFLGVHERLTGLVQGLYTNYTWNVLETLETVNDDYARGQARRLFHVMMDHEKHNVKSVYDFLVVCDKSNNKEWAGYKNPKPLQRGPYALDVYYTAPKPIQGVRPFRLFQVRNDPTGKYHIKSINGCLDEST